MLLSQEQCVFKLLGLILAFMILVAFCHTSFIATFQFNENSCIAQNLIVFRDIYLQCHNLIDAAGGCLVKELKMTVQGTELCTLWIIQEKSYLYTRWKFHCIFSIIFVLNSKMTLPSLFHSLLLAHRCESAQGSRKCPTLPLQNKLDVLAEGNITQR